MVAPRERRCFMVRVTLDDPEPVMPVFPDDMAEIHARVTALVGKIAVSNRLDKAHPAVTRLLEADAVRAKAAGASPFSWDKPLFESSFEKRRLRILNALMLALQRAGARPSLNGKEGRDIGLAVGSQHFSLTLDRQGAPRDYRYVTSRIEHGSDIMELGIPDGSDARKFRIVWQDKTDNPLERQLAEVVVELIVEGERRYRSNALNHYKWILTRREELREKARKRIEAVKQANEEQRIQREKERVEGLLHQAMDLRKANDIRNFVQAIMSENRGDAIDPSLLAEWMSWASAEADRIDPIKNGQLILTSGHDRGKFGLDRGRPRFAWVYSGYQPIGGTKAAFPFNTLEQNRQFLFWAPFGPSPLFAGHCKIHKIE
jgi:hypothetical protein